MKNKHKKCQLLLLCSPHNPTGRIWIKEEMDQIIKICKKYQVKIISDEIHMDIQLRDRKHIPLLSYIHEYDELIQQLHLVKHLIHQD